MAWVNGKSGTYNISTQNSVISGYVKWEEQYDVVANKSLVKQTAYLHRTNIYSGDTYIHGYAVTRTAFFGSETVGGTEVVNFTIPGNTSASGGAYLQVFTASKEIAHDADGSKNITLGFSMSNNVGGVSGSSFTVPKTTATVSLTTIPRATVPKLSAASVTMGQTVTINLTPADSSFKHKIRYEFGSLVSQIDGVKFNETQITADFLSSGDFIFAPPTSLAHQIPNNMSAVCKVIIYTYRSDNTHVGTNTAELTLNVPDYLPTIGGVSLSGHDLLNGMYVQGKSRIGVLTVAVTYYGAKIASYSIDVEGKTYLGNNIVSDVLTQAKSQKAVVTVTDTRGITATMESDSFIVYPYAIPEISEFTLTRLDDGTTVEAHVKGCVSSVNGVNAKTVKVTLGGQTQTVTPSSIRIDVTLTFTGITTDETLTGTAEIIDNYTSVPKDATLPTVAVTMDFHRSGKGIAMGKVAEHENMLEVAWHIKNDSVPTLLGGLGKSIPANSNLNTLEFIVPGNYVCSLNDVAKTVTNSPTTFAFKMRVSNVLDTWTDVEQGSYMYMMRELTNLDGVTWVQYVRKEGGDWFYSTWGRILDSSACPDYVVEQGSVDGWEYTKWNSGKMEMFGEKSLSFPEGTKQTDYLYRSIVSLDLRAYLTKIMSGTCSIQTNGMVPQVCRHSTNLATAEIVIVTSRTIPAFTITAPIYIIGKWK